MSQKICPYFVRGNCIYAETCDNLHPTDINQARNQLEPCTFFQRGRCRFGSTCLYKHERVTDVKNDTPNPQK